MFMHFGMTVAAAVSSSAIAYVLQSLDVPRVEEPPLIVPMEAMSALCNCMRFPALLSSAATSSQSPPVSPVLAVIVVVVLENMNPMAFEFAAFVVTEAKDGVVLVPLFALPTVASMVPASKR
jgi:hypothetical protein